MIDQKTLYESSEDVQYEWELFDACVDLQRRLAEIPAEKRSVQEHVFWNANLTALVILARNLIQFFYGSRRYKDDILAEDYCPNWSSLQPPKSALLTDIEKRTNKLAAHLSYERRTINKKIDWTPIRNELTPIWSKWKQCTPAHLLKPK